MKVRTPDYLHTNLRHAKFGLNVDAYYNRSKSANVVQLVAQRLWLAWSWTAFLKTCLGLQMNRRDMWT